MVGWAQCDLSTIKREGTQTHIANGCYDFLSSVIVPEYNRMKAKEPISDSIISSYKLELEYREETNQILSKSQLDCANTIEKITLATDSVSFIAKKEATEKNKLQQELSEQKNKTKTMFWKGMATGVIGDTILLVAFILVIK